MDKTNPFALLLKDAKRVCAEVPVHYRLILLRARHVLDSFRIDETLMSGSSHIMKFKITMYLNVNKQNLHVYQVNC